MQSSTAPEKGTGWVIGLADVTDEEVVVGGSNDCQRVCTGSANGSGAPGSIVIYFLKIE